MEAVNGRAVYGHADNGHADNGQEHEDYQDFLKQHGYVVINTAFSKELDSTRALFDAMLIDAPEFNKPDLLDPYWKPVLGGFGALANPSSFHHPWVRKMREMLMCEILDYDVLPVEGRNLEQVFDRVMFRRKGDTPTAESVHRDEAATAKEGDLIFGGWLNLDKTDQKLLCCPGTHLEVGGQNKGFAKIKDAKEIEKYRELMRSVRVPPGHLLVFYENIVHEVASRKAEDDVRRLHCGFRVTEHTDPLFGLEPTLKWINDQAVPKIKSGQDPVLFPSNYANFSVMWDKLENWSMRMFAHLDKSAYYRHTIKSKNDLYNNRTYWRVAPKLPSLRSLGLKMHPSYEYHEVALMLPQKTWLLDNGECSRVTYNLPSNEAWQLYKISKEVTPEGASARRPRPHNGNDCGGD